MRQVGEGRAGCPDWAELAARRGDRGGSLGGDWERALAHLDAGCEECRGSAQRADPLLLFRRLPEARPGGEEVESMRLSVRALRRNRELAERTGPALRPTLRPARLAAAACLLALLGLAVGGGGPLEAPARPGRAEPAAAPRVAHPLVEGLDRPGARVYQLRQDDLAVVMIVDETLDL